VRTAFVDQIDDVSIRCSGCDDATCLARGHGGSIRRSGRTYEDPSRLAGKLDPLQAGSDFADLFEVKDALRKKGIYERTVDGDCLILTYRRKTFERETRITADAPTSIDEKGLIFTPTVKPHGRWSSELIVTTALPSLDPVLARSRPLPRRTVVADSMAKSLQTWIDAAPRLDCDDDPLKVTYHRSLVDLAALRFTLPSATGSMS
jgi:hypothetical protein